MWLHKYISDKITSLLDNTYYIYIKKIYNDNLNNIFVYSKFNVIKPEYFIFSQYYFIYTFFYYISKKNTLLYSASLHLIYICDLIFSNLIHKYNYIPVNNIVTLKNHSNIFLLYLLFIKLLISKRIILFFMVNVFYFLHLINDIYKERLKSIEEKTEYHHPFKILIISPNKEFIEKIIYRTKYFTYSNFLLFINYAIVVFL